MKLDPIIEPYGRIVGQEGIDKLYQLAEPLKNIRIVHINSTFSGGGVAEILAKLVPMSNALNIQTHWEVIQGTMDFFVCTKSMHNAIQGNKILLSASQLRHYEEVNQQNSERLRPLLEDADIVFIHDPQPLPLILSFPKRKGKWVWRCHIDASHPFRPVWKYLMSFMKQYDAAVFSLEEFSHPLPLPMFIIPPSIDPLSDKNIELEESDLLHACSLFNIDPQRPIILQVSRFDSFKDPIGVVEAFRHVKRFSPDAQLVLAGSHATDDPQGETILHEVKNAAADDSDIKTLVLAGDAHRTINALQRAAHIVLQKSIKEGFGLTVTEALWKGKPVIGGNTGGIRLQIVHGQTGFLVNTPEGAAYRIRYLLQHPHIGAEMGVNGKEYVREKFLIPRHLSQYFTLIHSLLYGNTDRIEIPTPIPI